MALTGIVNLAERLLNQSQSQTPTATTPSAQNGNDATPAAAASNLDQFTSSNANGAQDAGLFSVKTLSLFTAAANFLLGTAPATQQNTATQSNPAAGNQAAGNQGKPTANSSTVAATSTTATLTTTPAVAVASVAPSPAVAATTPARSEAPATATSVEATTSDTNAATTLPTPGTPTFIPPPSITQTADTSAQLQSLNSSLAALGLSASDISTIDRIASLLNDFSPTAYATLVEQLETQAQTQAGQTTAAPAQINLNAAAPVNGEPDAAASAVPNGNGGSGGELHVQSLVLRFAGITATTTGPADQTSDPTQSSEKTLQLQDVSLTLSNHNGQAATLFATQPDKAGTTSATASTGNIAARSAVA